MCVYCIELPPLQDYWGNHSLGCSWSTQSHKAGSNETFVSALVSRKRQKQWSTGPARRGWAEHSLGAEEVTICMCELHARRRPDETRKSSQQKQSFALAAIRNTQFGPNVFTLYQNTNTTTPPPPSPRERRAMFSCVQWGHKPTPLIHPRRTMSTNLPYMTMTARLI